MKNPTRTTRMTACTHVREISRPRRSALGTDASPKSMRTSGLCWPEMAARLTAKTVAPRVAAQRYPHPRPTATSAVSCTRPTARGHRRRARAVAPNDLARVLQSSEEGERLAALPARARYDDLRSSVQELRRRLLRLGRSERLREIDPRAGRSSIWGSATSDLKCSLAGASGSGLSAPKRSCSIGHHIHGPPLTRAAAMRGVDFDVVSGCPD
jgi:hypothetical protein